MRRDAMNGSGSSGNYFVGNNDQRPWGSWCVTGVGRLENGEEFCEKVIVVNPGKILSLQSHEMRGEDWTVLYGTLIAIVDGRCLALGPGDSVHIPLRSIHTMANLGDEPCLVHERQQGVCSEDDIIRYVDAYGRSTAEKTDERIESSVDHYQWIVEEVSRKENHYA